MNVCHNTHWRNFLAADRGERHVIIQTSKNTQALRVINGVCGNVTKGNCRGSKKALDVDEESQPLPKRRRKHK